MLDMHLQTLDFLSSKWEWNCTLSRHGSFISSVFHMSVFGYRKGLRSCPGQFIIILSYVALPHQIC